MTETELESGLATYTVFPSGEATTCHGMSPTLIVRVTRPVAVLTT